LAGLHATTGAYTLMRWIDKIPFSTLILFAILLGLAPFSPEPHLWQKLKMLASGTLAKPIDIFDLLLHGTPVVLLAIKAFRTYLKPSRAQK
jgi:hypothetical protein